MIGNVKRRDLTLIVRAAVPFVFLFCALVVSGSDKKKDKHPATSTVPDRIAFDIRKIVWPNPPAIARIKFVDILTGEKIDWEAIKAEAAKKPKKSWMDRLAGMDNANTSNIKIPYQLIRPYGVAVDAKGNIYTADEGVGAIFIFNPETKAVQFIRNGLEAHFGLINGLAIDDDDRLFVSDGRLHKIFVFSPGHQLIGAFGGDVLNLPGGIALDRENRLLYVVDTGNDQVVVFDADKFTVIRKIGTAGQKHTLTDAGTFSLPSNVAVDSDGDVYVTDTLNNRVEIFDADGSFITAFGRHGDGPGYFARPKGIAVDCDKHIWVVDTYQDRVQVFDRKGRLLIYMGGHGNWPGQFSAAYGIAIDKRNRVITSEQYSGRLQIFQYVTDGEAEVERQKREAESKPAAPAQKSAPGQSQSPQPKDQVLTAPGQSREGKPSPSGSLGPK